MLTRLVLLLINIFFPPLTILLLTGPHIDTLISCALFLCGVIPSHIHGFYLSCTYFHRRKKARKGRYPGPPCKFIYDRRVWWGGLCRAEVERRARAVAEARMKRGEKAAMSMSRG
ncbi:40S ribosomal protein S19 [Physcia stellaris]|nr:40S ribosomal protein S19 [Physcia stellaris]